MTIHEDFQEQIKMIKEAASSAAEAAMLAQQSTKEAAKQAVDAAIQRTEMIQEVKYLREAIHSTGVAVKELDECFDKFKAGMGQRLQDTEELANNLKGKIEFAEKLAEKIFTPALSFSGIALVISIVASLSWYLFIKK